jgi:hypothetical protein
MHGEMRPTSLAAFLFRLEVVLMVLISGIGATLSEPSRQCLATRNTKFGLGLPAELKSKECHGTREAIEELVERRATNEVKAYHEIGLRLRNKRSRKPKRRQRKSKP